MPDNDIVLQKIRHSAAHVMAEAVLQLFPGAKIAIGPAIENGFYYDFDLPRPLTPEDLEEIEKRMKAIIKGKHAFVRKAVSRKEAEKLFHDQPYKRELIAELPESGEITTYTQGAFTDLCRGPHVANAGELDPAAVKLLSVSSAYWRGDEKRAQLQRIYGTAWKNAAELKAYLDLLKEIEKRDHRRLGKELDLFSLHEEAGAGLVYWHPKGARVRHAIEEYWKDAHFRNGYELLYTPHIGKAWLWQTSGHLDFFAENMYAPMKIDEADYYIKPMNCPFHILIYKTRLRSYRELPLRWAELGTVYRYERSGVLHGLLRVRGFTQDDAHIICTPEQMEGEILRTLRFMLEVWQVFGFDKIKAYLATRPAGKSAGKPEDWDTATASLKKAIETAGIDIEIDEGGGAFYGPKIDIKVKDAIGREWQLSTIQFDFNEPERFDMTFVDQDNKEKRPFMVHRALLGSFERFFGILIEHYAGAFPVWLAPVQVALIPVAEAFSGYVTELEAFLKERGLRARADLSAERFNAKIRNAQAEKIPYMIIAGEQEQTKKTVSVRLRTGEQLKDLSREAFADLAADKIKTRSLELK
jgi:threonyl-tRNA synthetase